MDVKATFLPVVGELLEEFGTSATLTRGVTSGGSRYKAGVRSSTTQTIGTTAVLAQETIQDEQGRLVSATVATMLDQPLAGDQLTLGQQTYVVGVVTAIAPQGDPIVWKAVVTQ